MKVLLVGGYAKGVKKALPNWDVVDTMKDFKQLSIRDLDSWHLRRIYELSKKYDGNVVFIIQMWMKKSNFNMLQYLSGFDIIAIDTPSGVKVVKSRIDLSDIKITDVVLGEKLQHELFYELLEYLDGRVCSGRILPMR